MTTIERHESAGPTVAVQEWPAPVTLLKPRRVEARRSAMESLDPTVRRHLARLVGAVTPAIVDVTVYDAIFPAIPDIGGHWTVAFRRFGLFMHTIDSYTVSMAFDESDCPHHFVVAGATEETTLDATEASLSAAIARVAGTGPLRTASPHVFSSIGI
jgi:hypothetical protein